jgi:hypothetical protein
MTITEYPFKDNRVRREAEFLRGIVPFEFVIDRNIDSFAALDFDEARGCFTIAYDDQYASETQDILHELLHIRQSVVDGFRKLASDQPILYDTVNLLGYFVDDPDICNRQ